MYRYIAMQLAHIYVSITLNLQIRTHIQKCNNINRLLSPVHTAAPQPSFHNTTVSASYGSNISLPCVVDVANPPPLYNWTHVSTEDPSSEINYILSDGSLQLKNVWKSGIYQCIAWNDYGSSLQIVKLSKYEWLQPHSQLLYSYNVAILTNYLARL